MMWISFLLISIDWRFTVFYGCTSVIIFSWFSCFVSGKLAVEGKVEHKFDMKPHNDNIEEYGRLCRERTTKSMIKNRQVQVILLY